MSDSIPNPVRAHWTRKALELLPPEGAVAERNAVITGLYARWYLQHQTIYKWAGMATFASHRVGLALAPYEVIVNNGAITGVKDRYGLLLDGLLDEINLVRETNNAVYTDIGWTHLAYEAPDGGLAAVEAGLSDLAATHQRMIEGWRLIDRGRKALDEGRIAQGRDDVWKGNALLLEHEQFVTVQPAFEKFTSGFDLFMSAFTSMNFDTDNLAINWETGTSFFLFMATAGFRVVPLGTLPDIAKIAQRWYWVEKRVLPLWTLIDGNDPKLRDKCALLASRCDWKVVPVPG